MVVADKVVMDKVRCRTAEESTQTVSTQAVVSCLAGTQVVVGYLVGIQTMCNLVGTQVVEVSVPVKLDTQCTVGAQVELNTQGMAVVDVVTMDKAVVVGTCLRFESKLN